ncbi:proteasome assembly chaperone family protein, partial [Candidatus Micrarchaeota archaeon]|nr:proteasome assembly chaperone family protein [Candidatus Micrarchaeota archaeon]
MSEGCARIVLDKKADLTGYTLIEGFPGIGLVGTIAAGYIIEKRKMKPVGYIYCPKFPPMAIIHGGKPYFPARIYQDTKEKFAVLIAEFVIPADIVYDLAGAVLDFAHSSKLKKIVSLAGMTAVQGGGKVYGIASTDEWREKLQTNGIDMINEGMTTGVSGVLIAKCASENFPAVSLLAEATHDYPDPRSASLLLDKAADIIGLKVDTRALMEEADTIEARMQKLLEQMKKSKSSAIGGA